MQAGDTVVAEHWGSSGFPNTDLEHQLKRYGKEKIICVCLLAAASAPFIGMGGGAHRALTMKDQKAEARNSARAAV